MPGKKILQISDLERLASLLMLVALRFFFRSNFVQVIGDAVGSPKSSVSRGVSDVSLAIAKRHKEFI